MDSDAFINPRYGSTIEMGGRPAAIPPRPSSHGADPEIRMLASRSRSLSDAMARGRRSGTPQTVRELVVVIDQGNLPTDPDKVAMTNPVEIDADDVEGATPTFTPDTDQTIPVVFIRKAPSPGDYAVAHAIAGRWVAEIGAGQPGCGCNACGNDATYPLPQADMKLAFDPPLFHDTPGEIPSTTLYWSGADSGTWIANDLKPHGLIYTLYCGSDGSPPTLQWNTYPTGQPYPIPTNFVSYDKSTEIKFHEGLDGTTQQDTNYTVAGPQASNPGDYCVTICVFGCSRPLAGATVTITDPAGKTVATGKTGSLGCATLNIGKPGTYTVAIQSDAFGTITDSNKALQCGRYGYTFFNTGQYICCNGGPIPANLKIAGIGGTTPFVYDSTIGGWVGCQTFDPGGQVVTQVQYCQGGGQVDCLLGHSFVPVTYLMFCGDFIGLPGKVLITAGWPVGYYKTAPDNFGCFGNVPQHLYCVSNNLDFGMLGNCDFFCNAESLTSAFVGAPQATCDNLTGGNMAQAIVPIPTGTFSISGTLTANAGTGMCPGGSPPPPIIPSLDFSISPA